MFDHTTIEDRLRTVSWSDYHHPTGMINRFTVQTFQLSATGVLSNGYIKLHRLNYGKLLILFDLKQQKI